MALIETITAKLQADVSDFQAGFQRAQQSVTNLQRATATPFGRGGFATGSLAAQQIMAAMADDAKKVPAALREMDGALTMVGHSFRRTEGLGRSFRTGLQVLAAQAIGIPGPLGKMASALLMFGTGGIVTTTVLAGIAGIAIGIERAKKAVEGFVNEAERIRQIRMGQVLPIGRAGPDQLAALQARLRGLQEAQRLAAEVVRPFQGRPTTGIFAVPPEVLDTYNAMITRQQLIRGVQQQIATVTQQIAEANTVILDAVEAQLSIEGQLNEERRLGKLFKQEELAAILGIVKLEQSLGEELSRKFGEGNKLFKDVESTLGLKDLGANLNKQFLSMGLAAMESLARGLLTGAKNVKELLFRFLLDISLFGIFEGIGGVLTKVFGIQGGGNLSASPVSNISAPAMSLQIGTGSLPPPMTPFEASRDAMWQRMLRESVLVAKSQGFR